jgi:P27 family predicted phage terminase small subunit
MGARGPAPKPTALRIIEGNPGKRPLNRNEPKPTPKIPSRPEWLNAEAKREWSRIVPELDRIGLLTIVDRAAITAYCSAWSKVVQAERHMQEEHTLLSPWWTIWKDAVRQVRAFCAEFGLTPSSRGRMTVPGHVEDDDSGLD